MKQLYTHLSMQLTLLIPMQIFPKRRPSTAKDTFGNTYWYTPKGPREKNLTDYFSHAMKEHRLPPYTTHLNVDCIFTCKGICLCDKDNADKTIGDCGKNILWQDDKQIKDGRSTIIENAAQNSIRITIKEIL